MHQQAIKKEVTLSEIPQELKDRNQWVAWRGENNNRKITKRPINPHTGALAKTNDPDTWGSFEQSAEHFQQNNLDGIGFVFSEDDPYVGIDIDDCINGSIDPKALQWIKFFNSYTEISPSGKGLHIIVKGSLPDGGKRKGGLEIYDRKRFFTFTGKRYANTPGTIADGEKTIAKFYEKFLGPSSHSAEKQPAGRNDKDAFEKPMFTGTNEKFQALWDGNYDAYPSQSEADLALCQYLAFSIGENAQAIDKMFRNSGLYRLKWDTPHSSDGQTYGAITIQKALETMGHKKKPKQKTDFSVIKTEFHCTDMGNAERLVTHFGKSIRYCHAWKSWLIWDGMRWRLDETNKIRELAKETVRFIYKEAEQSCSDSRRQALGRHAVASESESRIRAMASLAQSDRQIAITPDQFDQDKFLFNCVNGIVDLRTGNLLPHRKEHYITKLAKVIFDPYEKCPRWDRFLNRIMNNNKNLIQFLKRAVGYSLTGDTSEQCMFIFYGGGANGKSTFLRTVDRITGDYGQQTATETLLVKQKGAIPNDIARLKGARFITASEAEAEQRFAESLIKQMTGGDIITARFLHQEWFDFEPTYKIFLGTNHKPVIKGTDYAIWRRIKLVPFEVTIPEAERDNSLLDKLQDELSGILSWAIDGCLDWQKNGFGVPEEVSDATNEYKNEMDLVSDFIGECCTEGKGEQVLSKDLYQAYKNWCDENGEHPLKKNAFGRRMSEKGYVQCRTGKSGAKGWKGISLQEDMVEMADSFSAN